VTTRAAALVTVALLLTPVCSAAPPQIASQPISIGERHELHSSATGEDRRYYVHRPPDYELSGDRYPLLIVLDGEYDFQHAATTADLLAAAGRIPSMIVVGVPNTDRNRDLLPPTRAVGANAPAGTAGGADKFLTFLTTELIPKLDRDYRTLPYRILVGHSNGGLFALHALTSAPGTFNGYIVASPALGAADQPLLQKVGAFLDGHRDLAASIYLASANESDLLGGTFELASSLQAHSGRDPKLSFAFRRYPDDNHSSIPLHGIYDGLEFVFDGWSIADPLALYEQGGIAAIEKHYAALTARLGYPVAVPESTLLSPVFTLYRQKRTDEAERLILHTLELHPKFVTALLTAGRLYSDRGDKAKARDYLTQSLMLAPMSRAVGVDYVALGLDPLQVVPVVEVAPAALRKCTGTYGVTQPAVQIIERAGRLYAVMNDQQIELKALSPTRFFLGNGDGVIAFQSDAQGRITGLRLESRGADLVRMD
jgi:predicted alpha/beta superfamily hydrolase